MPQRCRSTSSRVADRARYMGRVAVPKRGDVIEVRRRRYFVEDVRASSDNPQHDTLITLVGLDDDNRGRRLEVFWELELGARVVADLVGGVTQLEKLDTPSTFAAYLNALRWNTVSATDPSLFQSPYRAGIRVIAHQMTALKKALELPRANLFIADDVGLGKTIEAGLVLQELMLRQRVEFVLIVYPAALCLQWRDEMAHRFGMQCEVYNRAFVSRKRQEHGFGVNPWNTHTRFIISHQTLRQPEYREGLLAALADVRVNKSLLILDEAHVAAPASESRYAVDSKITKMVREIAGSFKNRLF